MILVTYGEYPSFEANNVKRQRSFPGFNKDRIYKCVDIVVDGVKTVICVKTPEVDQWISKKLLAGQVWEGDIVKSVMEAMRDFPTAMFLGRRRINSQIKTLLQISTLS